jgi:hypothetical protein
MGLSDQGFYLTKAQKINNTSKYPDSNLIGKVEHFSACGSIVISTY